MKKEFALATATAVTTLLFFVGCGVKATNISLPERATMQNGESILITPLPKCAIPLQLKAKKVNR